MEGLKPCPFCGGNAFIVHGAKRKNAYGKEVLGTAIGCDTCTVSLFLSYNTASTDLVIDMWNRRVKNAD